MSGSIAVHVEKVDVGFWTYLQRSAGHLPDTPLYEILNWVMEQLNLGNCEIGRDRVGDVVSLTLGREAARNANTMDDAFEGAKGRLRAINYAGVLAQSRESGIQPEIAHVSKTASEQITEWGRRNTEFHYAFELIKVLARLNKKTFKLEAPPIADRAPASVVSYLRESTKCWLYGFHGASVVLSRACLEETLKTQIPDNDRHWCQLDSLIAQAGKRGLLDDCMTKVAHAIRQAGNNFVHGKAISESDSRETLDAIRGLVEHVFSS